MGCGASSGSKVSQKDEVSPIEPQAEGAAKAEGTAKPDAQASSASTTTTTASVDSNGSISDKSPTDPAPPGAVAAADEARPGTPDLPDDEDTFNAEPAPKPPAQGEDQPDRYYKRERRQSHSSESMDPNKVQIVTHTKTEAEKKEIQDHIMESTNFLFKGMTDVRAGMMASAMFKLDVPAGKPVITQGEDGDNFYLIGSGEMEVLVKRDADSEPMKVLEYKAGGTFGELALMYLCPRAATVKATTDCTLWALDRVQFRALMCGAEQQQANAQWVEFLEGLEILNPLNKFEKMTLANGLEEEDCGEDEMVIEQGSEDAEFVYILESGSCVAELAPEEGGEGDPKTMKEYAPGDYFGELAMLEGGPRKASVKVTSAEAHFLKIPADTFKETLGPIHEAMKKNAAAYKKYDEA